MPCFETKIGGSTDPSPILALSFFCRDEVIHTEKLLLDLNPMILEELF
jgi:hypothetical protein